MKKYLVLIAALALLVSGCATMSSSSLTYTPEIRKMSDASNTLFHDLLTQIGGVGFADETLFPNAKSREIVKIEVVIPYDNRETGVEHWTVQHDGLETCVYIVKFIPDGRGGTEFTVQQDKGSTKHLGNQSI
jgi:hypothetical protein